MRLFFACLAGLAFSQPFFAQNFPAETEKPEWAEPLFEDNITDFDAESGAMEFNYLYLRERSSDPRFSGQGFEVEGALARRLGIESEFQMLTGEAAVAETRSKSRFYGMELAMQYLLQKTEKRAWAAGFSIENQHRAASTDDEPETVWEAGQFLIFARHWPSGIDLQMRQRFEAMFAEGSFEPGFGFDGSFLWQKKWLTAGVEFSAEQEETFALTGAPQLTASFGNLSLGLGWRLPVVQSSSSNQNRLLLARLVYELE